MNDYEPQQYLSWQEVVPLRSDVGKIPIAVTTKVFLKSSTSILVNANETLTKYYDERDPFTIKFQVATSQSYSERHVEKNIVYINQSPESPKANFFVTVIVYDKNGLETDRVTSTISGDAIIRKRDTA